MSRNNVKATLQWKLTTEETITSFTNWKENLLYILELDSKFAPFLAEGVSWSDSDTPDRGFLDDPLSIPEAMRLNKSQKAHNLKMIQS